MPLPDKVQAITTLAVHKTKKQLRSFIGFINYYRDMWKSRSDILTPLSSMTSKQAKWDWNTKCQQAFDTIKKLVSRNTLLSYPNFNEPFEIHTDASKLQLGAVISQNNKLVAFYSRKLNPVHTTDQCKGLKDLIQNKKHKKHDYKKKYSKSYNRQEIMAMIQKGIKKGLKIAKKTKKHQELRQLQDLPVSSDDSHSSSSSSDSE